MRSLGAGRSPRPVKPLRSYSARAVGGPGFVAYFKTAASASATRAT